MVEKWHGIAFAKDKDGNWGDPVSGQPLRSQRRVPGRHRIHRCHTKYRSRKSFDRLLEGKGKVIFDADAMTAAGPVGRNVMAGTDAKLEAEFRPIREAGGYLGG